MPSTESTSIITQEPANTTQDPITTTTEFISPPEFLMYRNDWGANPPKLSNISKLELPIKRIIVGHTGGNFCFTKVR